MTTISNPPGLLSEAALREKGIRGRTRAGELMTDAPIPSDYERDVIHTRPTAATGVPPVLALPADEAETYVAWQRAIAKAQRIERELAAARQEAAKLTEQLARFAKEQP